MGNTEVTLKKKGQHSLVSHGSPEGRGDELDEGSDADEHARLKGIHAHLLEIHGHQGEQRPEGREEEEIEGLGYEQLLIHVVAEHVEDVGSSTDFMGGLLGFRVGCGVNFPVGIRIYEGPRPWHDGYTLRLLRCISRVDVELPSSLLLLLPLLPHGIALVVVVPHGIHFVGRKWRPLT